MKTEETLPPTYLPTVKEAEIISDTYKKLRDMMDLKIKTMPHFSGPEGDRSFLQYIDDSERILNGWTPSRESQGRDSWESNIIDNITRVKLRTIVTAVGLNVPAMKFKATSANGIQSSQRSEIMKQTVRHTFLQGNPTMQAFLELWQMMAHGVTLVYDGYLSGGMKRKVVTGFNSETGEVETEEKYVKVDGKPFNAILDPQDFFWWDFYKRDIQDQPHLAWLQRYTKSEVEREFGKFKNFKYIKNKKELSSASLEQETLHFKAWSDRLDDHDYEIFRFYSKEDDAYEIWINGVDMLRAPLLWGEKEKHYPFAKSISEPFANSNFFVGMSFPGLLEAYQENKTTIVNTLTDKLYRSVVKPYLVGLVNKDVLDIESEIVSQDNRIYVPDINQVKPWPAEGVNQSELAMLASMDRSIDLLSVDVTQQGQQNRRSATATEIKIADERARQMKGMLFMFLEDLWLQKNKLRVRTILTQYLKDKAKRENYRDNIITVPDVTFSDGARGTLDIHVANTKSKMLSMSEIKAREQIAQEQGLPYKIISMTKDYLDDWEYDFQVVTESLYSQDQFKKGQDFQEEMQVVATVFPEYLASNKDKYWKEFLEIKGKSADDFKPPPPPQQQGMPGQEGMEGGMPGQSLLGLGAPKQ